MYLSNISSNRKDDEMEKKNEKKPSRITVSDAGLVMSIISLLFVLSGIFLK